MHNPLNKLVFCSIHDVNIVASNALEQYLVNKGVMAPDEDHFKVGTILEDYCKNLGVVFYSAPHESFNIDEAVKKAKNSSKKFVIVEDFR